MVEEDVVPMVRLRKLSELKLYEKNARTHSAEQVETLMALMQEFGYTNPVLVDEDAGDLMVAGHGRHAALSNLYALGKTVKLPNGRPLPMWTIPTIDCSGWTEAQRRAYILADNQSALRAGWDTDLLRAELEWLKDDAGFDLSLTAFTADELDAIFEPVVIERDRDPDAVPDPLPEPHSQPGDVWVCGPHRVVCGDSTSIDSWRKAMGEELADCVWTDPPYNVAYESKLAGAIKNDDMSNEAFRQFLLDVYKTLFCLMKPGAPIYVAHADTEGLNFRRSFSEAGFKLSGCLMWRKDSLVLGRSDFQWMHEPILYGWKPGAKHRWYGGRKQTTVVELGEGSPFTKQADGRYAIRVGDNMLVVSADAVVEEHPGSVIYHEKPKRSAHHPTMKPVSLIEKMLTNSARSGHLVVDAFGGSGSTMIACDRLGMAARLSELDPKFVDVIVMRWQNYSGRVATHAATGMPFPVAPDTSKAF